MSSLRRIVRACLQLCLATTALAAVTASAASATTLYVNGAVAASGDCLSPASACKTINEAVIKARLVPDAATIDVAAGTYTENILLTEEGDANLTIEGAGSNTPGGTIIQGVGGDPVIGTATPDTGPTTINHLRIVVPSGDTEHAIESVLLPIAVNDVTIDMQGPGNSSPAVQLESAAGSFDHLTVSGVWTGPAIVAIGSATIAHSTLVTTSSPAAIFLQSPTLASHADLISDSSVQSGSAAPFNMEAIGTDLTIDSSLLLGGSIDGIEWVHTVHKQRDLTVAGSTIDAGVLGVRDPSAVNDLFTVVSGPAGSVGDVRVEGSILMEQQTAAVGGSSQLTVTCSNSDVPSQKQVAKGAEGEIDCANGENGNTTTAPASLFVAPGSNYSLLPGSSAIDSVPAGAISLPFGLTPSATDLAGAPRVLDGNGDCVALQDRGAFELQGHSAPCPGPPPPKPVAGVITSLSVSPSSFFAAPSGATISKAKAKKTYGTTISYKDSQAATTTFTVLKPSSGRTQGKSCKKPSKANKHGKRCTIYTAIGSFTHADIAGANKFHFSGRLKGKALTKGGYKLQAVPHNAAGNGAAVSKQFKIK